MAQFLTVMHDELMIEDSDDTIRAKVDEFLKEIVQLLTAFSGPKRKSAEQSDLVSQTDLDRFYSGIHTPWFLTTWICNAVEGWPQKIGVDPQKEPDKKIDVDKVQRICWKYYLNEKKAVVTKEDWLSPECTYRLFLLYNKLLLRDDTTDLEVGQVNAFLMKMVNISEYSWSSRLEYKAEGSEFVNFPEFVTVVTEYFSDLHLNTDFTCELIFELFELMVLGILKKGLLVKRGHVRKNWNRRYFVLQLTTLTYYEDKGLSKPKGGMMMNRNTKLVNVRNADSPKNPRMFRVTCGVSGKEFEICADDERTKQSWMLAIQKALALTKIRNPLNRDELVLSIAQFGGSVYGESEDILPEGRQSSNTISIMQDMSEKVDENLKRNRTSLIVDRMLSPGSPIARSESSPFPQRRIGSESPSTPGTPEVTVNDSLSEESSTPGSEEKTKTPPSEKSPKTDNSPPDGTIERFTINAGDTEETNTTSELTTTNNSATSNSSERATATKVTDDE
jgi:hypothetical protein